jgi:hypothetical protein
MAGRVQADAHAVQIDRLPISQGLQRDVVAQACAQHAGAERGGEVGAVTSARMVGVRVRDDRACDRCPGVDVKVTRRAVQAFGAQHDQVVVARWRGRRRWLCVRFGHDGECVA